jgi:hypothetical protein
MPTLEYEFCEMPLIIDLGFEAGLVNGSADISYHSDGEWGIRKIYLDGFSTIKNGGEFKRKSVEVEQGPLYDMIAERLLGEWHDRVQDRVNQKVIADGSIAHRFDHNRDALRHARAS